MRLLLSGLLAATLFACATDAHEGSFDVVGDSEGKTDEVEVNPSSPNARPGARYMRKRPIAALEQVGALTPIMKTIWGRMRGYGQSEFSVAALLHVEEPNRYATFLPEEKAEFPQLWRLLEIDDAIDLTATGEFPALPTIVELRRPEAMTLDTSARVSIADLPSNLQTIARRVLKPTTVPPDTISFAEVLTALDAYQQYTSAEYFHFGPLLRATERAQLAPASFPHLDVKSAIETTTEIPLGTSTVAIARTSRKTCDRQYGGALVSGEVGVRFTIPLTQTAAITWTPLNATGRLFDRGQWSREQTVLSRFANDQQFVPMTYPGPDAAPRGLAIVEAWENGTRLAQQLVVLPASENVGGQGLAIREAGNANFTCLPFDDAYDDSISLYDVLRLPPGRYPVPSGTYGTSTLNVYGLGVMRLDVSPKQFWAVAKPSPSSAVYGQCWSLTELGPRNMVTGASGAGPGFRLQFQTSGVYFNESSYGVCASGTNSGGSLVTTLTEASRL